VDYLAETGAGAGAGAALGQQAAANNEATAAITASLTSFMSLFDGVDVGIRFGSFESEIGSTLADRTGAASPDFPDFTAASSAGLQQHAFRR